MRRPFIQMMRRWARPVREECVTLAHWWLHEMRETAADLAQRWAPGRPHRTTIYLTSTTGRVEQQWRDGRVRSTEFQRTQNGTPNPLWRDLLPDDSAADDTPVHVVLPRSDILLRRVRLPAGAESSLAAVVELHLERELPVARDQVHVDWRIEARIPDGAKIDVTIAVIKRSDIERLLDAMSHWKLRVLSIGVAMDADRTAFNLAPRRRILRPTGRLASIDRWLTISAAALIVIYAGLVGAQWMRERFVVDASLAMTNVPAQRVERMRAQLKMRSEPLSTLLRLMQLPSSAEILADLTATMPNDSWLPQLEIHVLDDSASLKLTAITPAAALLVDRLERSPHIDSVELQSSTAAGLVQQDRVELSAHWTKPTRASMAKTEAR